MPAKDKHHEAVKNALVKEGWTITHDPYMIPMQDRGVMYVDIGAERLLAAVREAEKIAVEVKTFGMPSVLSEFHRAVGQYLSYKVMMRKREPDRLLFLAIPDDLKDWFMYQEIAIEVVADLSIHLLFYDPAQEEITQWIL
ncbi:MAG: XisH family protein [Rhodothermia bacterium]|nr:XisH family protein [Rhodothermia bacterium]